MIQIKKEDKELLNNVLETYKEMQEYAKLLTGSDYDDTFVPSHGELYIFYLRVDAFDKAVYDLEKDKYSFNHGGIITNLEYLSLETIKAVAVDLKMLLCGIPLIDIDTLKIAVDFVSNNSIFRLDAEDTIEKIVNNGLERYNEIFPSESVSDLQDEATIKICKGE